MKRELNSGWKTVLVMVSQCVIAWIAAFLVYHVGGMLL